MKVKWNELDDNNAGLGGLGIGKRVIRVRGVDHSIAKPNSIKIRWSNRYIV